MNIETMMDLYIGELQDIYNAEKQLIKALPKMARSARSSALADAFESHLAETRQQAERLERIFKDLDRKAAGETCQAMQGLISEGQEVLDAKGDDAVRDAGIIVAAQKVEHYEIAGYGSLCAFAQLLGRSQDFAQLKKSLDEEKAADRKLTELAEDAINADAVEGEEQHATSGAGSGASRRKSR